MDEFEGDEGSKGDDDKPMFVPLIAPEQGDDRRAARAALRGVYVTLLRIEACARAIAPFKSNGSVHGHKHFDDYAALEALVQAAPPELRTQAEATKLNRYELCQVFNQALRSYFDMDKQGKLTGKPSKRIASRAEA